MSGVCPECGGVIYTEDAILVFCEDCDFVSTDLNLLIEDKESNC